MLVSWGQFNKTFTSVVYKRSCCFQTPKQWPLVKVLFNWSQITIGVRLKIVLWFQMCGLSNTWALKVTAHYYRIFSRSESATKFTCLTFTIQKFNSLIFLCTATSFKCEVIPRAAFRAVSSLFFWRELPLSVRYLLYSFWFEVELSQCHCTENCRSPGYALVSRSFLTSNFYFSM